MPRSAIAAPLLVVGARLLQGFSAGAELGGVSVYLAEIAPPGRRGFFTAFQSASQQVAVIFASVLGLGLGALLPPDAMRAWGWRIPFIVDCAIIPFLLVLRRGLPETPVFAAGTERPHNVVGALLAAPRAILAGTGLVALTTVSLLRIVTAHPDVPRLLAVELVLAILYAAYNGAMVAHLTEIVPRAVRASAFSLAYALAVALFGGATPALATLLVHATGDRASPGALVSLAAVAGIAGALASRTIR